MAVLLEFPIAVVERADLSGFEPSRNTVEVEGVIAHPPGHGALLTGGGRLVGLTFNAEIHDVVTADSAVVHHDVPSPQGHGVPFLHLKPKEDYSQVLLKISKYLVGIEKK